jgi:phenylacetaldehyde dehydrogenase
LDYKNSSVEDWAKLLVGGHEVTRNGCYVEPTVLGNVRNNMKVVQEEIFGPVLVVTPFDDLDDAVTKANMTKYGLGASIWSRDFKLVHRLIPRLRAGTVWVTPTTISRFRLVVSRARGAGI